LKRSKKLQLTDLLIEGKELPISGLTADSRRVKKGYLFAALPGSKANGSQFIEDAIHHGANFILTSEDHQISIDENNTVTFLKSDNPRRDFAKNSSAFLQIAAR